ncbi:MAG TPA: hypothetical protein VM692_05800, partial [Gammaproteobacteria bacterium]|nr:hypothetical protein [Gammaproteobacteria bacterium]
MKRHWHRNLRWAPLSLTALLATACGGHGGDDAAGAGPPGSVSSGWVAGSFLPAASFAGRCVNPRAGTNPSGGIDTPGTTLDQNN